MKPTHKLIQQFLNQGVEQPQQPESSYTYISDPKRKNQNISFTLPKVSTEQSRPTQGTNVGLAVRTVTSAQVDLM